jgi:dTDP-4-dehydrorhamnose 3,5-epimerase
VQPVPTELPEIMILEPKVFRDERGFFLESYRADECARYGIPPFVQDNHSRSIGRTLRGLHLQRPPRMQAKLIRVIEGEIYDVAVDVRRGSPTFGRWVAVTLSAENFRLCYIPPGFAHGFCVTSAVAQVEYKCSDFYDPASEIGIAWNDPALGISWPVADPILSPRDGRNRLLAEEMDQLPVYSTNL